MSERRGRLDELLNQRVPANPGWPAPQRAAGSLPAPDSLPSPAPGPLPSPADRFEQVAAGMRRAAADLESAAAAASARQYKARSDDGTVAVILDGRPRVRSLRIGGQAVRSGPGQLAARVAVTVNRALQAARRDGNEALLAAGSGLESWVRGAIEAAGEAADGPAQGSPGPASGARASGPEASLAELRQLRRSVPQRQAAARAQAVAQVLTGTSRDARVSVTVNGLSEVTGVSFSALALHGSDLARLGNHIAGAVNAAFEKAGQYQRARHEGGGGAGALAGPRAAGDVIVEMFSYRMNGLLGRLDEMSRDLDGISDDLARGLGRLIAELEDLAGGPPAGQAGG